VKPTSIVYKNAALYFIVAVGGFFAVCLLLYFIILKCDIHLSGEFASVI